VAKNDFQYRGWISYTLQRDTIMTLISPGWQYSDGDSPNGNVEYKGAMKKSRFLTNIRLYLGTDAR